MLQEQINKDYISAMKQKDKVRASTLSFLRAQMKNAMIDAKAESLTDTQTVALIKKQVKQRQDSCQQYEKGGRDDLAAKERTEKEILQSYLPPEMPEDELTQMIAAAITEAGAQGMKDMGAVMKSVLPKVAGRADSQRVSAMVKDALGKL